MNLKLNFVLAIFSVLLYSSDLINEAKKIIAGYEENPQGYFRRLIESNKLSMVISETADRHEPEFLFLNDVLNNYKVENIGITFDNIKESPREVFGLAILDTGFNMKKLSPYIFRRSEFIGYDTGDNDPNPQSNHPHGTKMAEIAIWVFETYRNRLNIGEGTLLIVPIKIFSIGDFSNIRSLVINKNSRSMSDNRLADAVKIVKSVGVKVVNLSLAGDFRYEDYFAIKNNPDILFVVSAGNNGMKLSESNAWPAKLSNELDNILVVGALDSYGHLSSLSNYGEGVHIYTCGQFGEFSSTSSATAVISALVHMFVIAFPHENDVFKVKQAILDSSVSTKLYSRKNNDYFWGKTLLLDRDFENIKKQL